MLDSNALRRLKYAENIEESRKKGREKAAKRRARDREKMNKYNRDWRRRNPEKTKVCAKKYAEANLAKVAEANRTWFAKKMATDPDWIIKKNEKNKSRAQRISDLIAVLRAEMPELLKEFGL